MESKQARPKATENTEKSGSAFEQEGKGKTMAAPAFGLMASGVAAAMKAKPEDGIEAEYKSILEAGGYADDAMVRAARHVMRHYGMYDEALLDLRVTATVGKKFVATEIGKPGEDKPQTITISRPVFYEDFSYVVRTLGHEYQHALYSWNRTDAGNINENEFLAYSWELFGKTAGSHPNPTVLETTPKREIPVIPEHAVIENKMDSIKDAIKYYKKMPKALKDKHVKQFEEILKLKVEVESQISSKK